MEIIKILKKDPPVVVGEREEDTGREGTEVVVKKTVDDSNSQEQPNSNCFLLFYYIPGCCLRILVGGCGVSVTLGPRFLEPGGVGRQCEHMGMNNIVSHCQGLNTQSYILGFCCNFASGAGDDGSLVCVVVVVEEVGGAVEREGGDWEVGETDKVGREGVADSAAAR